MVLVKPLRLAPARAPGDEKKEAWFQHLVRDGIAVAVAHFELAAPVDAASEKKHMTQRAPATDDCFETAVARYSPVLHEAARRLTGSSDEASDLVQDAVMRAWTFWDRFEPGSNARAWLHRILMNTFINAYRKQRRERDLFRAAGEESRRDAHSAADLFDAERDGLGDEVGAALRALPVEFRAVVELVDLGDLSYREVATRLGCPIGTVMSRLHRARKQLQEQLAGYAQSEGFLGGWSNDLQAHAA